MQLIFFVLINFLLLFQNLQGFIYEVKNFHELPQHVDNDTLVILDIDDTLLIPVQTLGTDAWFQHRLKKYQAMPSLTVAEALDRALREWEAIRHLTDVKLVEPGSDEVVARVQGKARAVIGLTTQGLALSTRTEVQLKKLNIDLSKICPSKEDCYFNNDLGVLYQKGILFTSGTHKGKALLTFFEKINYKPLKVVFINDKHKHLKEVGDSLERAGIFFIGLRYAFSDQRVADFDPELTEIQFAPFTKIMSDEEALKVLKAKNL